MKFERMFMKVKLTGNYQKHNIISTKGLFWCSCFIVYYQCFFNCTSYTELNGTMTVNDG